MQIHSLDKLNKSIKNYQYILIDAKVLSIYTEKLPALKDKIVIEISEPEKRKNLNDFEQVVDKLLVSKIKRSDKLLVIGGGATSDLGGFVASTIFRGIEWDVVPTTLLSMIDASIGGKVGINTKRGKNLIGAFHLPSSISIVPDFLETLEKRDYLSGLGELVKYIFLNPRDFYLEENLSRKSLDELILRSAQFKNQIVKIDFKEKGIRECLNFGHTFGHAIEANSELSHGEAVYYGIFLNLTLFTPNFLERFLEIEKRLGLKREKLNMNFKSFLDSLSFDKKNEYENQIAIIIATENGVKPKEHFPIDEIIERLEKSDVYGYYFK